MTKVTQETRPLDADLELELERHRAELAAYAYRMLGSSFEAEDAVQETFLRAWRSFDSFEGRATMRTWLYRITTNVCLDMLNGSHRRALPMDLGPARSADTALPDPLPADNWVEPIPDGTGPEGGDPAEMAELRDSLRLALIAALQHLPPKQRAVLILREVLQWKAAEVADLLGTTVASVNSALQRARGTLATRDVTPSSSAEPVDPWQRALLVRYVDAFERYDMDSMTALLQTDATWEMPPYPLWLRGHDDIRRWCLGSGIGCRGSRLVPTSANGSPAFGQYRPQSDGGHAPWSLQVLDLSEGAITGICFFLDIARLFPLFGLPPRLDPEPTVAKSITVQGTDERNGRAAMSSERHSRLSSEIEGSEGIGFTPVERIPGGGAVFGERIGRAEDFEEGAS